MSEELKPCPFCGGEYIELQGGMHPKCNECGCEQSRVIGRESVAAWNTRYIPEVYVTREQGKQELQQAGMAVVPVEDLVRCYNTGYWTDAMIAALPEDER